MAVEGAILCKELELYGCIQCGRCSGGCPVSARSALNPRKLIYEALLNVRFVPVERPEIWECTTCATCAERCPKKVQPYQVVLSLRSDVIEGGRVKPALRDAMESTLIHGNPWGRGREKRSEWMAGEEVRVLGETESADLLYFVCCTASYDPRVQNLTRAMVKVLRGADIRFAVLGNAETCCANEMGELGEKGLFEMIRDSNVELFRKYSFPLMMTTSPHCFHTFVNDYPKMPFEVVHYTQLMSRLINEEQLKFTGELAKKVTYHDPCFLGKQNRIFDEPRHILRSIPGLEYLEMDRSRERSLCCEGGGGRMWMESEGSGERLAEVRVKDAVSMGSEILATACPFCLLTLEDAVKTTGNEDRIQVRDIVELMAEAM
ncbi:MAG TPA: (Fe-S)-binding protein [bacterium]|nr:(Fe-S)-binding protein [bacterium]